MTDKKNLQRFILFGFVGGIGFIIDASVLTILMKSFGVNLYLSRLISFSLASLSTWLLNRLVTFSKETQGTDIHSTEYFKYITVQVIGALINLLIFSLLLIQFSHLESQPVIPLAIGAIFGLLFNFIGAKTWVYPAKENAVE